MLESYGMNPLSFMGHTNYMVLDLFATRKLFDWGTVNCLTVCPLLQAL